MEKEKVKFREECQNAVKVSRDTLLKLIQDNANTEYGKKYNFSRIEDVEDFRKLPITEYDDYKNDIVRMMQGETDVLTAYPVEYFLTSSGSTKQKLIPMTQKGLNEGFDVFYGVALPNEEEWEREKHLHTSLVRTERVEKKTFLSNAHFWNEREKNHHFFDKFLGGEYFMFSKEIGDMWYLKLWLALAEPNLKSIYSIYQYDILLLLQYFRDHWREILRDMEEGSIPDTIDISQKIKEELLKISLPNKEWFAFVREECEKGFEGIVKRVWKNCSMINGIGGAVFGTQEQSLRYYLGEVAIHNFVYASSEAPIGIALEKESESYVCIPHGCFVEFLPLDEEGEDTKWIGELELGKQYELIITNFSGFYRYRLLDVVEVTGFYGEAPMIRFAFRKNLAVNIAGEKTNLSMVADCVRQLAESKDAMITEYSVCVDESVMPNRYCYFIEGQDNGKKEEYAEFLDKSLSEINRDYEDLRQLNQVAPPICIWVEEGSHAAWKERNGKKGHSKPLQFSDKLDFYKFMTEREQKVGTGK